MNYAKMLDIKIFDIPKHTENHDIIIIHKETMKKNMTNKINNLPAISRVALLLWTLILLTGFVATQW